MKASSSNDELNRRNGAMTQLFAKYVCGEIRETHWSRFVEVIDSGLLQGDDRRAFAAFFMDALDVEGDGDIYLPIVSEVGDLFDDGFRAAA